MPSIKNLAIRGTIWTLLGYGSGQLLRFGSNVILTRLLVPEMFGLMSLVNVFIMGLELFSDIGIGPSIIQNQRGEDPDFLNTAWTIQVIRGFGLWVCSFLIARPVASFYDNEQLLWLIPIVGFTTVIAGFNSTSLFTLNRKIALGKLTIFELVVQVTQLVLMSLWAYFNPSIWALVAGAIVSKLLKMVWSHWLVPGERNSLAWDSQAIRELLSFGRWIFISTVMMFLATQADRLILGKIFPLELLGVYTVAFTFADLPKQVGSKVSHKVIFPVFSQFTELPREKLRRKLLPKRKTMLMALAIFLTLLVSFGDLLILSLYDKRYTDAAWMLPLLALGIWPIVLYMATNPLLLAIGKPIYGAVGNSLKLLYMLIAVPIFYDLMGNLGAIIAIALNDLPNYGAVTYGMWREQLTTIRQDLLLSALLIGLITLVCTGRYFLGFGLPIDGIF